LSVGLFGFGLLGSIGSTFIRRRIKNIKDTEPDDSLVLSDLPGVLINGISAAIVLFLAVKGAVVVFSSGDGKLNPYMLFLFSEDVWSWARKKLQENLGDQEAVVAIPLGCCYRANQKTRGEAGRT